MSTLAFLSWTLTVSKDIVPSIKVLLLLRLSGRKLLLAWFPGLPYREGPSAPGTVKMPSQKVQIQTVPGHSAGTLVQYTHVKVDFTSQNTLYHSVSRYGQNQVKCHVLQMHGRQRPYL